MTWGTVKLQYNRSHWGRFSYALRARLSAKTRAGMELLLLTPKTRCRALQGAFLMRKSWCIMKDSSLLSLLRMTGGRLHGMRGAPVILSALPCHPERPPLSSWAPSPVILSVAKDLFLKVQEKDSSLLSLLRMTSRGRSSEWHIYVGVKYFWEFWKSFKRARWNHLYLNICHPRVRRYCMVRACNAIATPAARR